jgi:hypothetical protein
LKNGLNPDTLFSCDACLEGLGGMFEDQFVHAIFPPFITEQNLHINCLELLTTVVSLRTWGKHMTGKKILVFCDNEASVQVLNSGHTRDPFMQNCLREICFYAANLQFEVKAKYISGENNRLPDYLSRWEIDKTYRILFKNSIRDRIYHEIDITDDHFNFIHKW